MSLKKTLFATLVIATIVFSIGITYHLKQEKILLAKKAIDIVKMTRLTIDFKKESITANIAEIIDKYDLKKNIWNEEDDTSQIQEKTTWTATSTSAKNIYDVTVKNNIYNCTYTFVVNTTTREIFPVDRLATKLLNKNKKINTKSRL